MQCFSNSIIESICKWGDAVLLNTIGQITFAGPCHRGPHPGDEAAWLHWNSDDHTFIVTLRLRSASSRQVSVPRYRLSTYGRRAFSVAGPTVWNSLLTCGIRSVLWTVTDSHWRHFYFGSTSVFSALEVCYDNALYKFTFDIDIDMW